MHNPSFVAEMLSRLYSGYVWGLCSFLAPPPTLKLHQQKFRLSGVGCQHSPSPGSGVVVPCGIALRQ